MSDATITFLALAAATYVLKSAGPVVLGNRELPEWLDRLALLLPAPLLAALVASSTFVADRSLVLDARVVGLAVAAVALWRKMPFVVVVIAASAATAAARAIAGFA